MTTTNDAPAPAPSGSGMRVKPLEWVHDGENYRADAGFEIKYSVFRRLDGWFDAVLLGTAIGHGYLSGITAKEACQADFEARILSALASDASPSGEPGEGMAEMADIAQIVSEWRHGPLLSPEALRRIRTALVQQPRSEQKAVAWRIQKSKPAVFPDEIIARETEGGRHTAVDIRREPEQE